MKKIFLAAGHDFSDPGAVSGSYKESVENIRVVDQAVNLLKDQDLKGWEIIVVPHELGLVAGINWINQNSTGLDDFCIEVHHNAGGGTGTETFFYGGDATSQSYATKLNNGIVGVMGLANRGVKPDTSTRHGRLGFIRDTEPYAILPEMSFIDSAIDMAISRERGGLALAYGILSLIGSSFKTYTPPEPKPEYYKVYGPDGKQLGSYVIRENAFKKLNDSPVGSWIVAPTGDTIETKKPVVPVDVPEEPKPEEPVDEPIIEEKPVTEADDSELEEIKGFWSVLKRLAEVLSELWHKLKRS